MEMLQRQSGAATLVLSSSSISPPPMDDGKLAASSKLDRTLRLPGTGTTRICDNGYHNPSAEEGGREGWRAWRAEQCDLGVPGVPCDQLLVRRTRPASAAPMRCGQPAGPPQLVGRGLFTPQNFRLALADQQGIKLTPWGVYFASKGVPKHPNLEEGVPEDTQNSYKGVLLTPKKKLGCP